MTEDDPSQLTAEEKRRRLKALLAQERRATAPPPLAKATEEGPSPLSFIQEAHWFLQNLNPGSTELNQVVAMRLEGQVSPERLAQALELLTRRHAILRARFVRLGADEGGALAGKRAQVLAPPGPVALEQVELSGLAPDAQEAKVAEWIRTAGRHLFDLQVGPLWRAWWLRLGPESSVLVFCWHHIITDGRSTAVLTRDLTRLYASRVEGTPADLPPLPVQFSDFARWQRETTAGLFERQLAHWRARLEGLPPLELVGDRPRPPVRTSSGGYAFSAALSPSVEQRLRALAAESGGTLYVLFQAAMRVLLGRYSGQADFGVGTLFGGRRPETEPLIGPFANTLVLRLPVHDDPPFLELAKRMAATVREALANSDVPFDRVVQAVEGERDLSRTPLFQALVDYRDYRDEPPFAGVTARPYLAFTNDAALTDLAVLLLDAPKGFVNGPAGLSLVVNYSRDLFDPASAALFAQQAVRLLESVAADPSLPISRLTHLGEAEEKAVLELGRGPTAPIPAPVPLAFEAQAQRTPQATAVEEGDASCTYAALEQAANRMAARLDSFGVGPGVTVYVLLDRGIALMSTLLGVLKTGAAFSCLDPSQPPERLAAILADAGPSVAVTTSSRQGQLEGALPLILCVDDPTLADEPDASLGREPAALEAAYVVYTSGSTGTPRGVVVHHQAFANAMRDAVALRRLGPGARILHLLSPAFDAFLAASFAPLLSGATLVFEAGEKLLPGPELVRLIEAKRITTLNMALPALRPLPLAELPEVTTLVVGGEQLDAALLSRWVREGRSIVSEYGPTETTISATTLSWSPGHPDRSLGVALPNVSLYVLDEALRPVGRGLPGELFVGGVGVARGYLNQPGTTAERFLPDPFGPPGARMYRTGDRVRMGPSGALQFLGRVDYQVKLRGYRIDLGEVEVALLRQPQVANACAVVRSDGGEPRLVAYVVARPGESLEGLPAELKRSLPEYMIPARIVALPELPLTTSGKVDRKRLPAPPAEVATRAAGTRPQTPTEGTLERIWCELLQVPSAHREDDFFELGGNSLLATELAAALLRELQVEVAIRTLFEARTLAAQAILVDGSTRVESAPSTLGHAEAGPSRASLGQEACWALLAQAPDTEPPNVSVAVRLEPAPPLAPLKQGLLDAFARHEILSARFEERAQGELWQCPAASARFSVEERALPPEGRADPDAYLAAEVERERALRFEPGAPWIRAAILPLEDGAAALLLTAHRLVADGPSLILLAEEAAGLSRPPPASAPTFADWASWQRERLSGDALDDALTYWAMRLRSAPPAPLRLPGLGPGEGSRLRRATPVVTFDAELSEQVRARAQQEGVSLFVLLETALQVTLLGQGNDAGTAVCIPTLGREPAEARRMVGPFVNPVIVQARLDPGQTFRDVLVQQGILCAELLDRAAVPFDLLRTQLGLEPRQVDLLQQVDFSLHEVPGGAPRSGTRLSVAHASAARPSTVLSLSVIAAERLGAQLTFDPARWSDEAARGFLGAFERCLREAVRAPEQRLEALRPAAA